MRKRVPEYVITVTVHERKKYAACLEYITICENADDARAMIEDFVECGMATGMTIPATWNDGAIVEDSRGTMPPPPLDTFPGMNPIGVRKPSLLHVVKPR